MYRYPSFFEFSSVIRSQWVLPSKFSLLWYEFLLSIRDLSITWPLPGRELSRLGEPKRLYEEKLSRFPKGYPTCRGETTRSPELSRPPRRVRDPDVNDWLILQRNKLKLTSARVTRWEGCLGYPRPYKWGLRDGGGPGKEFGFEPLKRP